MGPRMCLMILSMFTLINAYTIGSKGFNRWGPILKSQSVATDPGQRVKTIDILSLDSIRSTLIRQEETIIFALIERSQFLTNKVVYEKDAWKGFLNPNGSGESVSFLDHMLIETEKLHHEVRRYTSPEEHAFFPEYLPDKLPDNLPPLDYPTDLLSSEGGASSINLNSDLLQRYITEIVPAVTESGDDEQHGSTVLADIAVLQALSRRIHYGKFVAESKYRDNPDKYQELVDAGDAKGVYDLLTNMVVEKKVLRRARLKAATYGREPLLADLPEIEGNDNTSIVAAAAAAAVVSAIAATNSDDEEEKIRGKVDPIVIERIYKNFIIPLTKEVEVAYLFLRCGREPPLDLSPNHSSTLVYK